jgi:hypothetical protein
MDKFIFLDYYIPYAGLCNQLYLISNHIYKAYLSGQKIYLNKFNIDVFKKNRVPVSEIIDLEKTNENLNKYGLCNIILYELPENKLFEIPELCIYPVTSIEILSCLEFHKKFKFPFQGYGIHFRIDIDCIVSYLFDKDIYHDFIKLCNNDPPGALSKIKNLLNQPKIIEYINFLFLQYINFIKEAGFDKTWYISTPIGKNIFQNELQPYLNKLTDFITSSGGSYVISKKMYNERELNALVDLLILTQAEKVIVFEGSSFSEGYVVKVNSARKNKRTYYTVQFQTNTINNEIYESC